MTQYTAIIIPIVVNIVTIAIGWGKISQRMQHLEKRFDEERHRNETEARDIQKIQIEAQRLGVALWGIDGNNGLRSQVRDVIGKVEQIQKDISTITANHNRIMDAIESINDKLHR
jgi:hypothetical protein